MATEMPQLFGIVPTGSPLIATPTAAPAPTSVLFSLPLTKFTHLTVFLLPNITLPQSTAAAVYLAPVPPAGQAPDFKFLGGIGPGKESAVYKVSNQERGLVLGINIEDATSVAQRMAEISAASAQNGSSTAVVRAGTTKNDALVLAQRIIKNAFNFLASFSGNVPVPGASGAAGVEVVPLKAFEEWWKKFEGKVRNDPSFLERDTD